MVVNPSDSQTSGVYIIGYDEIPNLYKIGFTGDLKKRYRSLKNAMPFDPVIYHFLPCDYLHAWELEKRIHALVKDNHIRREWYRLNIVQIEDIKAIFEVSSQDIEKARSAILRAIAKTHIQTKKTTTIPQPQETVLRRMANGEELLRGKNATESLWIGESIVSLSYVQPLIDNGYIKDAGETSRTHLVNHRSGKVISRTWFFTKYEITETGQKLLKGGQ